MAQRLYIRMSETSSFHNSFLGPERNPRRIPLKAVAASHDPGRIARILIAEGAGKKLHGFIDNGSRDCGFGCDVWFSARFG